MPTQCCVTGTSATVALRPRRQLSIALWAGAGLTISALLAAITVALNRRMRIVDPVKGIHFDKVGLRRWLVDYEIALRRRLDQT
jgi:hypothetical protein